MPKPTCFPTGVVTFEELTDASARVTVQFDWAAEGILEKAGAVLGVDDRMVKKDLRKFKDMVEGRLAP
jgi:uncharacterized membrane protein